jgi:hypothetical protein
MLAPSHSRLVGHHHPRHPQETVTDQEGVGAGAKGRFQESSEGFEVMIQEYGMIA